MFPEIKINRTRFAELAYIKQSPTLWRLVVTENLPRLTAIGPQYRTKAELLADLTRYATDYGCA